MRKFAGQDDQKAPGSRPGRLYIRRYRSIPFPATFALALSPSRRPLVPVIVFSAFLTSSSPDAP